MKYNRIIKLGQLIAGVLVVALSARITIDVGPIPVSGQSIAVLLVGYFLGSTNGALALVSYLLIGGLGLPVFADGASGWEVFSGGSGGFLVGFIFGAWLAGRLGEKNWDQTFLKSNVAMLLGTVIIILFGLLWLSYLYDFSRALEYGFYPFLWGAVIKILIGALVIFGYKKYFA